MKAPLLLSIIGLIFALPTSQQAQQAPAIDPQGPVVKQDTTLLGDAIPRTAKDKIAAGKRYLGDYLHEPMDPVPDPLYEKLRTSIGQHRDPETQFGPYIFGLKKPGAGVLTDEQIARIDLLIEAKNASPINWHDARNTIRMQALITLWAYATEFDKESAAELKEIWEQWNELRLAYMFQEFIAKDQFQRKVWAVFTPEQKAKLIAGDYDEHIKKNTGHARSFSAAKRVLKEFGQPDHPAEFEAVAERWETAWPEVMAVHQSAAKFARQTELAMDEADEAFARTARQEVQAAFDQFTHAERDAIRELIQAGYEPTPELARRSEGYQYTLRTQMIEKYREHARRLLRMLGEMR